MKKTVTDAVNSVDMPEFFNTWCFASVGLFALNNHFLKFHYHNWFTGKLSDIAACFFLPLFISAVLAYLVKWPLKQRVLFGALVTAVLFSLVKVSTMASGALNHLLSNITLAFGFGTSTNIADTTDLIALPMIAAAYYFALNR